MKKYLHISVLIFASFILGFSSIAKADQEKLRTIEQDAYSYGEHLVYDVGYKFITAGQGYIKIMPKPVYRRGRECFDVRFAVKSLPELEFLYKIHNQYRSVIDIKGIFPWEFQQRNREGKYKKDFKAVFDQYKGIATTKKDEYNIKPYTHDILSAFFYVRTMDFKNMKKGNITYLENFYDDSTYTLGVKYLGKERIKTKAGEFDCIKVEPMVSEGGLFQHEGTLILWLSDDKLRVPVKIATKILIGYVEAELTEYKNLNGKFGAKL